MSPSPEQAAAATAWVGELNRIVHRDLSVASFLKTVRLAELIAARDARPPISVGLEHSDKGKP